MAIQELTIRELGPQGDGIAVGARGRVFVERAAPGDRVEVRVSRTELGVVRGEIVRVCEPSDVRREPICPHFDSCGNCSVQHLEDRFYTRWKHAVVEEALAKRGLYPRVWKPDYMVPPRSRRRITFSAVRSRQGARLGYYKRRSQEIVDITSCEVASSELFALRKPLREILPLVMTERDRVEIFLQKVGDAVDMLFTGKLDTKRVSEPNFKKALSEFMQTYSVVRVGWRASERERITTVAQTRMPVASFGKITVGLPADAFLQPTLEGENALVEAIESALPSRGKFADLFAGCGTFSGAMLKVGSVDAYEVVPQAVTALQRSRFSEGLTVYRRDLFKRPLRREEANRYDAIVIDPPRSGCLEQSLELASCRVPRVIMVSCNPATFARDVECFTQGGYRLESVKVVDQFLWSHHVEVVGVLTKKFFKRR